MKEWGRDNGIDMIFNMFGICFLCFRHKKKKILWKSGKIQHDVRAAASLSLCLPPEWVLQGRYGLRRDI